MFKSFEIRHFRGFDQFQLDDLKPVNIIGGLNNVGKTCLLEAMFIHAGFGNAELLVRTNFLRGLLPTATSASTAVQDFIGASFYRYETLTPFVLESTDDVGKKRKTTVTGATEWETKATSTIASEIDTGQQRMGVTLNLGKLVFEEDGTEPQEHNILLRTGKGKSTSVSNPVLSLPLFLVTSFTRTSHTFMQKMHLSTAH